LNIEEARAYDLDPEVQDICNMADKHNFGLGVILVGSVLLGGFLLFAGSVGILTGHYLKGERALFLGGAVVFLWIYVGILELARRTSTTSLLSGKYAKEVIGVLVTLVVVGGVYLVIANLNSVPTVNIAALSTKDTPACFRCASHART